MYFYFYIGISLIMILISLAIVNMNNPVYSVSSSISVFPLGTLFLFSLRTEFLSIIFLVIYIGAIAVLFLFVSMMLNIRLSLLKINFTVYLPISLIFILFFISNIIYIYKLYNINIMYFEDFIYIDWINFILINFTNIHILGLNLYTYYFLLVYGCALLLFLATIGSVLLSYISYVPFESLTVKRYQDSKKQIFSSYKNNICIK